MPNLNLNEHKHVGRYSNLHQCIFEGDKGKQLPSVHSEIFNFIMFFPRKFLSGKSFQKVNFCISIFTAKDSEFVIFMGNI